MKKSVVALCVIGLSAGSVLAGPPAQAAPGALTGPSASISWDDSNWYRPNGCSEYVLQYSASQASLISEVTFLNQFGDQLGSGSLGNSYGDAAQGSVSVQVCSNQFPDDDGTDYPIIVQLKDKQSSLYGDGSESIYQAPALLRTRTPAASQSPSSSQSGTPTAGSSKFVRCIKESNFKQKRFKGKWAKRDRCPRGWVKITI